MIYNLIFSNNTHLTNTWAGYEVLNVTHKVKARTVMFFGNAISLTVSLHINCIHFKEEIITYKF